MCKLCLILIKNGSITQEDFKKIAKTNKYMEICNNAQVPESLPIYAKYVKLNNRTEIPIKALAHVKRLTLNYSNIDLSNVVLDALDILTVTFAKKFRLPNRARRLQHLILNNIDDFYGFYTEFSNLETMELKSVYKLSNNNNNGETTDLESVIPINIDNIHVKTVTIENCIIGAIHHCEGIQRIRIKQNVQCAHIYDLPIHTLVVEDANIKLGDLPNLESLRIKNSTYALHGQYNKLHYLSLRGTLEQSLPVYENLRILDITQSQIKEVPYMPNIYKLYCSNSCVEKLPDNLDKIIFIDVSNTHITHIPYYETLVSLECSNTNVSEIPPLENLKYLHCSNTNICELPYVFTKIIILDINNTNLPYNTILSYKLRLTKHLTKKCIEDDILSCTTTPELYDNNITQIIHEYLVR